MAGIDTQVLLYCNRRVFALAGDQVSLVNEYGAEYFKVSRGRAISVFFHGMGHYDLLASP